MLNSFILIDSYVPFVLFCIVHIAVDFEDALGLIRAT